METVKPLGVVKADGSIRVIPSGSRIRVGPPRPLGVPVYRNGRLVGHTDERLLQASTIERPRRSTKARLARRRM